MRKRNFKIKELEKRAKTTARDKEFEIFAKLANQQNEVTRKTAEAINLKSTFST
jgi:hypothetical protein